MNYKIKAEHIVMSLVPIVTECSNIIRFIYFSQINHLLDLEVFRQEVDEHRKTVLHFNNSQNFI